MVGVLAHLIGAPLGAESASGEAFKSHWSIKMLKILRNKLYRYASVRSFRLFIRSRQREECGDFRLTSQRITHFTAATT